MMKRAELGRRGEEIARAHLENSGYTVVERNWRGEVGELDLVVSSGDALVFVEVKTRCQSRPDFGEPEEAVTSRKAARIRSLAAEYLAGSPHRGEVRFDVIAVNVDRQGNLAALRHLQSAF